jgi:hypothetical protein
MATRIETANEIYGQLDRLQGTLKELIRITPPGTPSLELLSFIYGLSGDALAVVRKLVLMEKLQTLTVQRDVLSSSIVQLGDEISRIPLPVDAKVSSV